MPELDYEETILVKFDEVNTKLDSLDKTMILGLIALGLIVGTLWTLIMSLYFRSD